MSVETNTKAPGAAWEEKTNAQQVAKIADLLQKQISTAVKTVQTKYEGDWPEEDRKSLKSASDLCDSVLGSIGLGAEVFDGWPALQTFVANGNARELPAIAIGFAILGYVQTAIPSESKQWKHLGEEVLWMRDHWEEVTKVYGCESQGEWLHQLQTIIQTEGHHVIEFGKQFGEAIANHDIHAMGSCMQSLMEKLDVTKTPQFDLSQAHDAAAVVADFWESASTLGATIALNAAVGWVSAAVNKPAEDAIKAKNETLARITRAKEMLLLGPPPVVAKKIMEELPPAMRLD